MSQAELTHLMSAYYHEDYEGIWSPIDDYLADTEPPDVEELLAELDGLIEQAAHPEFALRSRLTELGSYVAFGEDPAAYLDWIREIRRRCAVHLESAR